VQFVPAPRDSLIVMARLFPVLRQGRAGRLHRRPRRLRKRVRRTLQKFSAAPPALQIVVVAVSLVAALLTANLVYQMSRKPTELLWFAGGSKKTPGETWRRYGALFRTYSTEDITPEVLAALAQVEGAGDPLAHTYWHWQLAWDPFRIYGPASSSVGMFQMTDAAFADARRYCIREHVVKDDCWFNGFYTRVLPSNAVELAAVFLETHLTAILSHGPNVGANPEQKQDLAAIIYLCGPGPAEAFTRRGFKLVPGERCGDQDVSIYLAQFNTMKREFVRLAVER